MILPTAFTLLLVVTSCLPEQHKTLLEHKVGENRFQLTAIDEHTVAIKVTNMLERNQYTLNISTHP